ncbi:MAG: hypothetical protein P8Y45_00130 [Exilibacterium sp.]
MPSKKTCCANTGIVNYCRVTDADICCGAKKGKMKGFGAQSDKTFCFIDVETPTNSGGFTTNVGWIVGFKGVSGRILNLARYLLDP